MSRKMIQTGDKLPWTQAVPLSFQHLFAMFGASILVPMIFKIDPATVLLMNGIGTLLYIFLCQKKVPAYLGSSFAFLAPVTAVLAKNDFSYAQWGFIASGLVFILVALIIKYAGIKWLDVIFPKAAMGAIVALIGLELAPVAAGMAGLVSDKGPDMKVIGISMFTLAVVIIGSVVFRGFLSVIPVLIGVGSGYLVALGVGGIEPEKMDALINAPWVALPHFSLPATGDQTAIIAAIITILPAAMVVIAEHISHLVVTGNIVGKDFVKDPGLHRSMMGDGVSTVLSGLVGAVPTTTYGENIGVLAITKVYSVTVLAGAAIISILMAFSGKFSALIQTIPTPVLGGISLLLFGVIAASGIRMLVESKVDYSKPKNLILTSVVLVIGLSKATITIGTVALGGMALATFVAIFVSLIFYIFEKLGWMNEA